MVDRTPELAGTASVGTYIGRDQVEVRFDGAEAELLTRKGVKFMIPQTCQSNTLMVSLKATFDDDADDVIVLQNKDKEGTHYTAAVPLRHLTPNDRARLDRECRQLGKTSYTKRRKVIISRNGVVQVRWEEAE